MKTMGGFVAVEFGVELELLLSLISWTSGMTGWLRAAKEVDVDEERNHGSRFVFFKF
jgi:hypothetical protein